MYGLTVAVVPTHKPRIRTDHAPIVYFKCRLLPSCCPAYPSFISLTLPHAALERQKSRYCGPSKTYSMLLLLHACSISATHLSPCPVNNTRRNQEKVGLSLLR